jgi:maleate isomerase
MTIRIGQIVPSSNTTMETEIPAMLAARALSAPERFSFHASRMRMKHVTPDELAAMDAQSLRCAAELADARVDIIGYACLVAIMAMGAGYHRISEAQLARVAAENAHDVPVVTSAGALIDGLTRLGAKKVAIITPYMKPLTQRVIDYIEAEGFEVVDSISLEVQDNLAVGRLDPSGLPDHARRLAIGDADVVVLSACVQMPSLAAIAEVETRLGRPTTTAAAATTFQMLRRLDLPTRVPGGGALLSGAYD